MLRKNHKTSSCYHSCYNQTFPQHSLVLDVNTKEMNFGKVTARHWRLLPLMSQKISQKFTISTTKCFLWHSI